MFNIMFIIKLFFMTKFNQIKVKKANEFALLIINLLNKFSNF